MGYSIAVHCQSRGLQKRMTTFMERHYRGWALVSTGKDNGDYSRFASNSYPKDSRLSYDHCRLACGFDYNACEPERDYIFSVVRWMCLKVGVSREFRGLGREPCFFYDGGHVSDDRFPVVASRDPDLHREMLPVRWRWALGDELGYRSLKTTKYMGTPAYEDAKKRGELEKFLASQVAFYDSLIEGGADRADVLIRSELERLDRLWQQGGWVT